jgi:hypothetical protein
MQIELKRRPAHSAGLAGREAMDEASELALLAEFMCANSVASLAGHIARRLGSGAQSDELIVAAGLGRDRPADRSGDLGMAKSRVRRD